MKKAFRDRVVQMLTSGEVCRVMGHFFDRVSAEKEGKPCACALGVILLAGGYCPVEGKLGVLGDLWTDGKGKYTSLPHQTAMILLNAPNDVSYTDIFTKSDSSPDGFKHVADYLNSIPTED